MSSRAVRRAAQHRALKRAAEANKVMSAAAAGSDNPTIPELPDLSEAFDFSDEHNDELTLHPISAARLIANRANAALSTGPKTAEGKAKSSLNGVKTGLTGRTVVLPSDDATEYQHHLDRHFAELTPATDQEEAMVQTIADTEWRLLRIAPLESGIYAIGRRALEDQFAAEPDLHIREGLLQATIFITYRKDLNNLALQERRLRNQRNADRAELLAIQQERIEKHRREIQQALEIDKKAFLLGRFFDPPELGFAFSAAEFQAYKDRNAAQHVLTGADLDFDRFLTAHRRSADQHV